MITPPPPRPYRPCSPHWYVDAWDVLNAVDNYQGEESDIIVGSFVRSNDGGQMGFVGDPNRLNVAISRARYISTPVGRDVRPSMDSAVYRSSWAFLGALCAGASVGRSVV